MRNDGTRSQQGGVAAVLAGGLAVLLTVVVVGFLLLDGAGEDDRVLMGVSDGVPAAAYRDVVLGVDREALTERLRPARPVDADVLERYPASPGDGSCLHYRAAGSEDDLYRFCFEDDRLVAKSVVSPDGG